MISIPSTKQTLSIIILIFVNVMFCYKYIVRETALVWGITLGIVLLQVVGFYTLKRRNITFKLLKIGYVSYALAIIALVIIANQFIDLNTLGVDRWSVIDSFWTLSLEGGNPYLASSHMGNPPGSMPIYFVLAFPFWFLGELSIWSSVGYFILIWLLFTRFKNNISNASIGLYLATAVFLVWEILTRSNIITNTMLIILMLDVFCKVDISNLKKNWWVAVLLGLLLATRGNFAVVYIIFFMFPLVSRQVSFKDLFKFTLVAFSAFASVFLILLTIYGQSFIEANPFLYHSTLFVPTVYIIGFFVLAFVLSFISKSKADLFFYSGIVLFAIILLYAINLIVVYGFIEAYLTKSWIDISYFLFCVPFFIWYLLSNDHSQNMSSRS